MNTQQQVIVRDSEETTSGLPAGFEAGGSLAIGLARAEIDQQILTARAMPRSITRAVQNITTLATLDEASAEECVYALPRAGKAIKGPSIRLAEIIAGQWGNCRVGARVVHVDRFEKFVEAEGVFHDLETNTATTSRVRRRLSNKRGDLLAEDMIIVTGNAACAIAKRNAILGGVPKAVWRKAYDAVEAVVAGDIKTLSERRGKAIQAFGAFGVTPEQIFTALGVGGLEDIGLEHLSTLTASRSALKSGEATIDELFPKIDAKGPKMTMAERLDALAEEKTDTTVDQPSNGAASGTQLPGEPQAGVGTSSSPQASSTPATLSDDDGALLADLTATGAARAESGSIALREFLDGLTPYERKLLPNDLVVAWVSKARLASAGAGR
jgi:hypothetical protein